MEDWEMLDIIEKATSDINVIPPSGVFSPSKAYHMQWKSDPGTMVSGKAVEEQRAYDQEQFLKELLMVPRLKREKWNKEGAPLWEYTGEGKGVGAFVADLIRFPLDTILAPHNVAERLQAWGEKRLPNDEKIATVLEAAGVGLDLVGMGHVGKKVLGSVGEAGEVALKGLKKEKALSDLVERIPPEAEAIFKHDAYLHAPSEEALQKLRDWNLPYMYSYKPDSHNMSYIEMGDNPIENIPELKMILSSEGHSAYPMLREMLRDLEAGGHSQLSASIINDKFKNILEKTGLMSKSSRSMRDIIDLEYPKLRKLLGRGEKMSETSVTKGASKRKADAGIVFSDDDLAIMMDESSNWMDDAADVGEIFEVGEQQASFFNNPNIQKELENTKTTYKWPRAETNVKIIDPDDSASIQWYIENYGLPNSSEGGRANTIFGDSAKVFFDENTNEIVGFIPSRYAIKGE